LHSTAGVGSVDRNVSEDRDAIICKAQAVQEEMDCLCLEDKGTTILQNIRHHSANDTASHLRRLEFKQF
jgi:hypothetical protein